MQVLKFGGSSVANAENIGKVAVIVSKAMNRFYFRRRNIQTVYIYFSSRKNNRNTVE